MEKKQTENSRSSVGSTVSDVVHAWMRGEIDYPGDSYLIWVMDEYMRDHIRNRHLGLDVLASSALDNAEGLIHHLREHFNL